MTTAIPEGLTNPDDDVTPVDLDEVIARFHHQPGVITDPDEIAAIRARRLYAEMPFWKRWRTPTPPGWRDTPTGPIHS
jgi:hypothetical protein